MPDYERFSVEEFARDSFFQQWVVRPQDEHRIFWERWLSAHPQQRSTVNQARKIIQTLGFQPESADNADFVAVWEAAYENMKMSAPSIHEAASPATEKAVRNRISLPSAVAASIAAIGLLALGYFWVNDLSPELVHNTDFGQTQNIVLPDGSQVVLNANSSLAYNDHWSATPEADRSRAVWLEGEAFFQVTKQEQAAQAPVKFVVRTQDLTISVLGTEFNVNQRDDEVQIVLTEGEVHLQNSDGTVDLTMAPGELVRYSSHTHRVEQTRVNATLYTAWKENHYIFEDTALGELESLIENTYGKRVLVQGESLRQRKITATIPTTELSVLLAIIRETLNIEIKQSDDQIIFRDREPTIH